MHGVGSSGYLRDVNMILISSSSRARVDVLLAGESKEGEEMEGRRGGVRYPLSSLWVFCTADGSKRRLRSDNTSLEGGIVVGSESRAGGIYYSPCREDKRVR